MKYLVTGAAGFIGYHVIKRLCQQTPFQIAAELGHFDVYQFFIS